MSASPGRGRRQGRVRLRHARSSGPRAGEQVILVRRETNPDDLHGMIAAQGILTSRGGKTTHAAVVARGMGKTCVCGAEELEVDIKPAGSSPLRRRHGRQRGRRHLHRRHDRRGLPRRGAGRRLAGGRVLRGRASTRSRRRAGQRPCTGSCSTPTRARRLGVRANADNGEDAARAGRFGAQGIGLCRTEHMFLGERRAAGRAADPGRGRRPSRQAALDALLPLQRDDFVGDLRGDGRAAGDHPAARPAAARVPARPHRAVGQGRAGRRRGAPRRTAAAGGGAPAARAEPDARPARRPARPGHPRPVRACRSGRSRRRRPTGSRPAATRGRRS